MIELKLAVEIDLGERTIGLINNAVTTAGARSKPDFNLRQDMPPTPDTDPRNTAATPRSTIAQAVSGESATAPTRARRGRPVKSPEPEPETVAAGPSEADELDEEGERDDLLTNGEAVATKDDCRQVLVSYQAVFGKPFMMQDGGRVLKGMFPDGSVRSINDIPDEKVQEVYDNLSHMLDNNPYRRQRVTP